MTNTTDTAHRSWHIVSPAEHIVYELPPHTTATQADAWLTAAQENDVLDWSAVLVYSTEAAARDLLAGLIAATDPDRPRWNA